MLRLLMGKAKSGKSYTVHEEIAAEISKGNSGIILLVPEQYTLEAEKALLAQLDRPGILGVEVVSFKRLIYKLMMETEMPPYKEITTLGRSMILRKVLMESAGDLSYYQAASHKRGFLDQFSEFLEEMKHGLIGLEKLNEIRQKTETEPLLTYKLDDLAILMDAYENAKSERYMDTVDTIQFALQQMPQASLVKNSMVWIDGFDSFSKIEYRIIEGLIENAKHVSVTVPNGTQSVFEHPQRMAIMLTQAATAHQIEVKNFLVERQIEQRAIEFLSEEIMAYPYQRLTEDASSVRLHAANDLQAEVEACIAQMIELVNERGYAWKDMAVVTNDLSGYEFTIAKLFKENKLPYFIDRKYNVLSHPLIHFILNALKVISEGIKPEAVLGTLKTGLLPFKIEEIALFENYIVEFGIKGRQFLEPFKKNHRGTQSENQRDDRVYPLETLEDIRVKYLDCMEPMMQHTKSGRLKVKSLLEAIYNAMAKNAMNETIASAVDVFMAEGSYNQAQAYAQIWNVVMDTLDQTAELMGEEELNVSEVADILDAGFDHAEVGLLPLFENQVLVGSLDRSKSHPIKALFILGVNDGILPEAGGDQQLISEHEKEYLKELGYDILLDGRMFAEKEAYNIYQAMTRPSSFLYISYALANNEGQALRPSYLVQKIKKILPKLWFTEESVTLNPEVLPVAVSTPDGAYRHLAKEIRRHTDGHELHPCWEQVFKWHVINRPREAALLMEGLTFKNEVHRIENQLLKSVYEIPVKTSVSRLEQYMWCPFKHFVSYGIKPNEVKPYEITYPDVGTLFHESLEKFGKRVYDQRIIWEEMTQEACYQLIEEIIDEMVLEREVFGSKYQYQYLIQKLRRVSKRAIWTLTKQLKQGDFVPMAFEMAFSDEGFGAPPMVVELKNGERLMIRGVIDRVDLLKTEAGNYVKIIDYKSGNTSLSISDIYHGLQMQLMVYLKACIDNPDYFRMEALMPGGVFYFKIDDPLIQSTDQLIELIEAQIENRLKLDGVALEDPIVLEKIDKTLMETGKSSVMKVSYKKDGTLSKDSKVLPLETFYSMIDHVQGKIKEIGESLMEGHIEPSPCQVDNRTACQACHYQSFCQFDIKFENNAYRNLPKLSHDSVIERIKEGTGEESKQDAKADIRADTKEGIQEHIRMEETEHD